MQAAKGVAPPTVGGSGSSKRRSNETVQEDGTVTEVGVPAKISLPSTRPSDTQYLPLVGDPVMYVDPPPTNPPPPRHK